MEGGVHALQVACESLDLLPHSLLQLALLVEKLAELEDDAAHGPRYENHGSWIGLPL